MKRFMVYIRNMGYSRYSYNNRQQIPDIIEGSARHEMIRQLKKNIKENNVFKFKKLLTRDFIYPHITRESMPVLDKDYNQTSLLCYEYYYKSTFLEALYFEYLNDFYEIFTSDEFLNNPSLLDAFCECLPQLKNFPIIHDQDDINGDNNRLIEDIPSGCLSENMILDWSPKTCQTVTAKVVDLQKYGADLPATHPKAQAIKEITTDLLKKLTSTDEKEDKEKDQVIRNREILKFKLNLLKTVHSADSENTKPRHEVRDFFINFIATAIFPIGLVHLCLTGNWFFFKKTTTEKKLEGIHSSITDGPVPSLRGPSTTPPPGVYRTFPARMS